MRLSIQLSFALYQSLQLRGSVALNNGGLDYVSGDCRIVVAMPKICNDVILGKTRKHDLQVGLLANSYDI